MQENQDLKFNSPKQTSLTIEIKNDEYYGYIQPSIAIEQEKHLAIRHCHNKSFNKDTREARKADAIQKEINSVKICLTYFKTYLKQCKKNNPVNIHEVALVTSQITADKIYLKNLKKMQPNRCAIS